MNLSAKQAYDYPDLEPRRLLNSATSEQVLVRDLFGERISKLYAVDTTSASEAIVDDHEQAPRKKSSIEWFYSPLEVARTTTTITMVAQEMHYFNTSVLPTRWNLSTKKSYGSTRRNFPAAFGHSTIEALINAIDVNAGRSVMKKEGVDNEELARRVNIEAARRSPKRCVCATLAD